jgi:hypothetical protein
LACRLLTLVLVSLACAAPARADLVQLDRDHAALGARLAREAGGTELVPELRLWRVPTYALAELRRAGVVHVSRPETMLRMDSVTLATDPLVPLQWWRPVVGADAVDPPGPGKPVTVVDSGVDITHPEFAGRPNTVVLNEQTTTDEDEDHGTEVSSVVAAPNNGVGMVGVYPQAVLRIWDASPFGFLNEGAAIQGIVEAARRGPGVINLSFGGEDEDPLLRDAILLAFRSGSLVVAAAGNGGIEGSPREYPAAYPHVLTVGATTESGRVAVFSTLGPFVDLAAPGARIDVAEPLSDENQTGYDVASGTSFSSPMVAGAAAWVWTTRPDLDNTQLFEIMRRSAVDFGAPGVDAASGYGLLNIPRALEFRTPPRDPQEPNEDPNQIEPHGLFASGTSPMTSPAHSAGTISARVDRNEDPVDLYRVWAPARRAVRASAIGPVALRLLARAPKAKRPPALATGKRGVVSYLNRAARGRYIYLEVRPALVRTADYSVHLRVARR